MNQPPNSPSELAAAHARIAELESELARYTQLVDNIPGMVYEFCIDAQGVPEFTYVSPGSHYIYGLPPQAIKDNPSVLLEAIHPDDQVHFQSSVAQSAETLENWFWEGRPTHAEAREWIQAQAKPQRREDGTTVWQGIVVDITQQKKVENAHRRLSVVLDATPDVVGIADVRGNQIYLNPAGRRIIGIGPDTDITSRPIGTAHPAWATTIIQEQAIPAAMEHGSWVGETAIRIQDGTEIPVSQAILYHPGDASLAPFLATIMRDIRDRKQAEQEQQRLQQQIIQAQETILAELSTPLIQLHNEVVLLPLIGTIDTHRAVRIMETLLSGTAEAGARVAIIDVSGVPLVDTQVATTLIQAAQALRLLGTKVVLTGIRPEMAQTLVSLSIDLRTITTFSNLAQGLDYALK